MDKNLIFEKFGGAYVANPDTYHMGIHSSLGDKIAQRFKGSKICLDTCLGAGFMTLNLAKYVEKVIGVDVNPAHLEEARNNTKIAGIESQVEIIQGDVLEVIDTLEFDSAFLDPDWAKVGESKENHVMELYQMVPNAEILLEKVFKKAKNVCLRLPKEFDLNKLNLLSSHESEAVYQDDKLKFYCIYFGSLIKKEGNTELRV